MKGDKYSSSYLFFSLSEQLVYFHEAGYYYTILSHYLHLLAKVLKNRHLKNFAGKYLYRSVILISQQPATFLTRDSDLDVFLGILENCQEYNFHRAPWNSCLCIYGTYLLYNLILISFPTIWDTRKYWNVYMWNQNYANARNYFLSSLLTLWFCKFIIKSG